MKTLLEEKVEALIDGFDSWFQERSNEPLVGPERALLKTFCWYLINEPRQPIQGLRVELQEVEDGTQASRRSAV